MTLVDAIRADIDEVGAAVFFTDQHIADAANEAQLLLYTLLHPYTTTLAWIVRAGEELAPLPAEIMVPLHIEDTEHLYFPTAQAELERYAEDWMKHELGAPRMFVIWDALNLRPYPRPDQSYIYTLTGIAWPQEISTSVTDITAPRLLHASIVSRAVASLLESTAPHLADAKNAEAEELENEARKQLRNLHGHKLTRLNPAPTGLARARNGNPYFRQSL